MPKSHPRRNAAEGKNRRFGQVFAPQNRAFRQNSRNGCRSGVSARFPALRVEKVGASAARDDRADRGHRDAGLPRGLPKASNAIFRERAQDLVVVAAGDQCFDADDALRDTRSRAASDSGIAGNRSRPTRRMRRKAWSDRRRARRRHPSPRWHDRARLTASAIARLRHAIAADQRLARGGIAGRARGTVSALEDRKPERGIADGARSPRRGRRAWRRCAEPSCPAARGRTP